MSFRRALLVSLTLLGMAGATSLTVTSCTSSNFSGSSGKKSSSKKGGGSTGGNPDDPNSTDKSDNGTDPPGSEGLDKGKTNPDWDKDKDGPLDPGDAGQQGHPNSGTDSDGSTPIRIFDDGFPGVFLVKPIEPERRNFLWAVTVDGKVTWMRLEGNAVVEKKNWSGAVGGPGGARTYVLEGGSLVIGRTGGYLFFIDPDVTPQGDLKSQGSPTFYKLNGPDEQVDRVCLVSYRKDKKRYIGLGYGKGSFVEIPQENTKPFKPQWASSSGNANAGGAQWGYSCFVDQDRLIYYSQWAQMSQGPIQAVDLKTLKSVTPATAAPNGAFTSAKLANETVGAKGSVGKGSYAMGGDREGNVLNGTGYYTMGFEPKSGTVWGSGMGNGMLGIFPSKCLSKDANCSGYATFNTTQMGFNVGPLSALGDGHMVGMVRNVGTVMLMSLKDNKDITKGIDATPIAQLGGDPYMYVDFTGATLYLTKSEQTFELDKVGFDDKSAVKGIGFSWATKGGADQTFKDIKMEIRCYKSSGEKPGYEEVAEVKDALKQTFVLTDSCKDKKYDRVDIRLSQLNDGETLMNVRKMQITAYQ